MAKEYHQGKHSLKTLGSKLHKKQHDLLSKVPFISDLYLETNDGTHSGNIILFKTTEKWEKLLEWANHLHLNLHGFEKHNTKVGSHVDLKHGSKTLRLYKSGGRLQNVIDEDGNAKSSKQPSTAQQEDGVVVSLNYGQFDPTYVKETVGFAFDKSWNESFEKTFNAISSKIKIKQYDTYRDSDNKKPKFLNEITDESILPDKKDNWNPADMWLVKKGYKGTNLSELAKKIKSGAGTVAELNELIEEEFNNGNLIGISLKKVGSTASFKKIIVDHSITNSTKFVKYKQKQRMSVLNSYMDVNFIMEQSGQEFDYLIRLRPRGKSGSLKVYFEGKPPSRGTWDGAVSKKLLESKYFNQKLNDFEKLVIENDTFKGTFDDYISTLGDKDLSTFLAKPNKLIDFVDTNKRENNTYFLQRGAVLAYCVYLMADANQDKFYKDCVLSAMKMNDFSSVYYKVY